MLQVLSTQVPYPYTKSNLTAEQMFEDNGCFIFSVQAPIYWWVDFSGERTKLNCPYIEPATVQRQGKTFPVHTIVSGNVFLTYQQIVELCEDYIAGAYKNENSGWIAEREWNDFCETLLDIKGIRDLIQEEN